MAKQVFEIKDNKDTGSVIIPIAVAIGTKLQLSGEDKPRAISYVATCKNGHSCCYCKGSGPMPLGDFTVTIAE
jgi:hypothetical protein